MQYTVRRLCTVEEMLPNLQLITQLSPQLSADTYNSLLHDMVPHNYFQVVIMDGEMAIGVSGYWICTKLYSGKYLEIDNFVIDEGHRSKGAGKLLLDWIQEEARLNGCATVMLDAYVENFKAHRFYYREGFIARGFHYMKKVGPIAENVK